MTTSIARRGAVQLVTLASATLSAAYYTQQAPDIIVTVHGTGINMLAAFLGVVAFALDTIKPEMARIAGDGDYGALKRLAAGFVFALLFVASMLAVDGFLIKLRSDWAATRGHAITDYAGAGKAVTDLEAEVQKVATARTTEQVRAAMDKARVPARTWKDTEQCTKIVDDDDRRLCRPILDLREEMAAARRSIGSQRELAERFACAESTMSEALADLEARGLIRRRVEGRRKVTEAAA